MQPDQFGSGAHPPLFLILTEAVSVVQHQKKQQTYYLLFFLMFNWAASLYLAEWSYG